MLNRLFHTPNQQIKGYCSNVFDKMYLKKKSTTNKFSWNLTQFVQVYRLLPIMDKNSKILN